ncbi:MAG: NADH-quinone oxidoreductase subunit NuoE [Candidatus Cloacimonetes bacterium]|nr:NADH-quinone oxidoreductase subunit NuoE [Candidatus Cloacimonadota bacterium]
MLKNKKQIDEVIYKFIGKKGPLIPLLQEIQSLEGYLSKETMRYVADKSGIHLAKIYGVATFYSMFQLKPQGKHIVRICKGTACHVAGANIISDTLCNELGLKEGEESSEDGLFTVMEVACLGCCGLAPAMMIDKDVHGKLTPEKTRLVIHEIRQAEGASHES